MRKPLIIILLLSSVITAKAQQASKPANFTPAQALIQDNKPEPEGGLDNLLKYLKKNANHQYNNADNGTVTIGFVVEKDGSLTGYKIVHSLNKEADGIAIQVLKDYNKKWKPAMQNSQPVSAPFTVEVPFGR